MTWLMFKSSASVLVPRRLTLVASAVIFLSTVPLAEVLTRRPSGVACSMVRFSSQM